MIVIAARDPAAGCGYVGVNFFCASWDCRIGCNPYHQFGVYIPWKRRTECNLHRPADCRRFGMYGDQRMGCNPYCKNWKRGNHADGKGRQPLEKISHMTRHLYLVLQPSSFSDGLRQVKVRRPGFHMGEIMYLGTQVTLH